MFFVYDIETAENETAEAYYEAKEYTPDASLNTVDQIPSKITELKNDDLRSVRIKEWQESQSEKIKASVASKRRTDRDRAPLQWWTGKVICICAEDSEGGQNTFNHPDERQLLTDFFTYMKVMGTHPIGKSSAEFDQPFLIGRALFHDIGLPQHFRPHYPITDITQIWGHKTCQQVTSLSNICWGLALEEKKGHGSEVGQWYKDGLHDKIAEYCRHDTKLVMDVMKRWEKRFGV